MARFVNTTESISSSLMLWRDRSTQIAIEDTFTQKIWPVQDNLNTGNPSTFNIPPQPNGMMTDIEVVTKFHVNREFPDSIEGVWDAGLSVVNNFANALWSLVEIKMDDRVDLMQSMHNAYAYSSFFNHALNSDSTHEDYLFYNELFKMDDDTCKLKKDTTSNYWISHTEAYTKKTEEISSDSTLSVSQRSIEAANFLTDKSKWERDLQSNGGGDRSERVYKGESVTTCAKLQCPLLNTSKCLPTNMKIRVSLTKNNDKFLIMSKHTSQSDDHPKFSIVIEDVYLAVTYYRPRDQILRAIETRLQREPAPYFISKPEIIIKPVTHQNRVIRITDVFHDKLPPYAFFCLQDSNDFEGSFIGNPFNFIPFKRFQFYVNGAPYFNDALEVGRVDDEGMYHDFGTYLRQLYRTVGKDLKGNCLINSSNFLLHFMVGMSFGADKSSTADNHLNLQEKATTYLEIDMGIKESDIPADMILIAYAVYDRQIQIDGNRKIKIID